MIREPHGGRCSTWRDDASGTLPWWCAASTRKVPFGAFCAGGDIRFFHQAALAGDRRELEAFFTEEYALNHLIHTYPEALHRI